MTSRFTLTTDHLALARRMSVDWSDGAPTVDPKKPYGNSDVESDIAGMLGLPWDDDDDNEPTRLRAATIHREMETVLRILLGHAGASVKPGEYVDRAKPYSRPDWRRVDS